MKTRKELKAAYEEIKPIAGVFQIKNSKTRMALIGDSIDIQSKWNRHHTELSFGCHRNKQLQNDWNASGSDSFKLSILSELTIKDNQNTI